jgi:uncharacterized protein (DUF1778 family)
MEFRLPPELKEIIEMAAATLGQTVTDYSVSRLVEIARDDLRKYEVTVLSDRDRDAFLDMLQSQKEPNEALKRGASRYRKFRASKR